MFCSKCGTPNPDDVNFCTNCGAPMNNQAPNQQQPPVYQSPQPDNYAYRIQPRSIATCIILSIITCGIYGIVWFVSMVNDLNMASNEPNKASGGLVFLLSIITCGIYLFYWMYSAGQQINRAKAMRNLPYDSNNGLVYLLLSVFGFSIVSYALIQNELNQLAGN